MSNSTDNEYKYDWNGIIIKKKYICICKLGHGSYSAVWLAYNLIDKTVVAIKIHNSYDYKHGINEYTLYRTFNNLNIPHILNPIELVDLIHEDEQHCCIVMELMGCSLYDLMKMKVLTNDIILKIMSQIFECLDKLHQNNYVHADLKPENILIAGYTQEILDIINNLKKINSLSEIKKYISTFKIIENRNESESESVSSKSTNISLISKSDYSEYSEIKEKKSHMILKDFIDNPTIFISDLGSCISTNTTTYYKKFANTCYYLAPEVLLKLKCNHKVDMWAVGCTLYELLTNDILFDPDEVSNMKSRYHLTQIISCLGDIPEHMKNISPNKEIYFKKNGLIKGVNSIKYINKWEFLECTPILISLLLQLLELDPDRRISANDALKFIK